MKRSTIQVLFHAVDTRPPFRQRAKLALTFAVAFTLLALLQRWWGHGSRTPPLMITGGVLAALALLPVIGRLVYVAWMGFGVVIGLFTQPIFMAVAYVLLFVPVGLVFRLMGRDVMRRQPDGSPSYWEDYPDTQDKGQYFKQY
jgi:hypothetical protein